jgi:NAD(P)H-dependent FMN reductase
MEPIDFRTLGLAGSLRRASFHRGIIRVAHEVAAAGAEIVAVTTDLTRQKFRDTNLLDRSHIVDDPHTLPTVVRRLVSARGQAMDA